MEEFFSFQIKNYQAEIEQTVSLRAAWNVRHLTLELIKWQESKREHLGGDKSGTGTWKQVSRAKEVEA